MMQEFTLTLLQCKLLTTDTEKLCYVDARTGALLEVEYEEQICFRNFNFNTYHSYILYIYASNI